MRITILCMYAVGGQRVDEGKVEKEIGEVPVPRVL